MSGSLTNLNDYVEVVMGQAPPGDECNKNGDGTVFVKAGEFQARTPVAREWTTKPLKMAQPNDSLVCVVGATAGKVNLASFDCAIGRSVAAVRPKHNKIDPLFLYQFLQTRVEQLRDRSQGAAQGVITREMLLGLSLAVPPLTEQRRIAAILDQAETLRTQRRTALALLDSLTQSLFLDMFGDDDKGEPRFEVAALVDVLDVPLQNGAYYPKEEYVSEGGVEMVHMSDAFNGIVSRGSLKRVNCSDADLRKYGLNESDILLARRSLTYEGAAKPCLVPPAAEPLIFESSFIRVTPDKKKLSVPYLFHYLDNATIREKRVRPFVTQSTISGINQSNLERVAVVVPPLPLQQSFATRIAAIEALKATHRRALAALDALFASLQQRAFAGQL